MRGPLLSTIHPGDNTMSILFIDIDALPNGLYRYTVSNGKVPNTCYAEGTARSATAARHAGTIDARRLSAGAVLSYSLVVAA
jgi:hypothetical protein